MLIIHESVNKGLDNYEIPTSLKYFLKDALSNKHKCELKIHYIVWRIFFWPFAFSFPFDET